MSIAAVSDFTYTSDNAKIRMKQHRKESTNVSATDERVRALKRELEVAKNAVKAQRRQAALLSETIINSLDRASVEAEAIGRTRFRIAVVGPVLDRKEEQ